MLTIARLFGKSPFAPLQTHMDKVSSCLGELPPLFKAILEKNGREISLIAGRISKLEHEADLTKNDIRNHLPKSLFLPVDRESLLEILSLQDALADQAQEISRHAEMRPLDFFPEMLSDFTALCQKNMEVFWLTRQVIKELEELLESSFGGIEAEKVKGMVEQIAYMEYEIDLHKNRLVKILYGKGDEMPYPSFHLSLTLIEEIGRLANVCEKLGNRVRMLLDLR
jgi:hypothetical protein